MIIIQLRLVVDNEIAFKRIRRKISPRAAIDFAKGRPPTDLPNVSYFMPLSPTPSFFSKVEETSHSGTPAPFTHSSRVSWTRKYSRRIGRRSNCHREQLRRSVFPGIKITRVPTSRGRVKCKFAFTSEAARWRTVLETEIGCVLTLLRTGFNNYLPDN